MHRFVALIAFATFVLLLVGGVVNPTGSSLACPDWPLCYGSAFPEMKGGVLFEHTHRLVATGVGILTVAMAIALFVTRKRDDRALPWLGLAAVALVALQGVLGGLTVIYKLPTAVSTAHLGLSMIFFSFLLYLAHRLWPRASAPTPVTGGARAWVTVALALVYVQILIGGLVRHTGASLSCLDVPLCGGAVWPAGPPQAQFHMIHRFVGTLAAVLVIVAGVRAFRALAGRAARWLALAAPALALTQVTLGVLSVLTLRAIAPITAHLGVAALLLADLWLLRLAMRGAANPSSLAPRKEYAPLNQREAARP